MKIFDIHCHIYPDNIAQKATSSVQEFYGIGSGTMNGTVDMLLKQGSKAGISGYLVLPVAIRPDRVKGINDFIVEQVAEHDCFVGFGTVHAGMDNIADEAERIMGMGLRGIKMHPDSQRFPIDDVRLFPMYEAIAGKVPVLLHMGDYRYNYSHPIRLRRVIELFPKLEVVAAHFGGYSMQETACDLLKDTNCIMDISSSMMFMEDGEPERYINLYGAERMAFGTDYPMWDPVVEVEKFLSLKLSPAQMEQVAHKTAERLLGLSYNNLKPPDITD